MYLQLIIMLIYLIDSKSEKSAGTVKYTDYITPKQ